MPATVHAMYFSPTRTTRTITETVAEKIADQQGCELSFADFTLPSARPVSASFGEGDVLVFGFPVYAGRVPALVADQIARLQGNGAHAVIVALYGNRHYDDAVLEAADLLAGQAFCVSAAGAFIGEHAMTAKVATGRPDASDLAVARQFGADAAARLASGEKKTPGIKGSRPYKEHPAAADIRPLTTDSCTACGICVRRCAMGVIDREDPTQVNFGCIRCNACVKACPEGAKYFDSELPNRIVAMLESQFTERKEPELFL